MIQVRWLEEGGDEAQVRNIVSAVAIERQCLLLWQRVLARRKRGYL